ncbi:MAG: class I SAM-dependent methyltransferase [Burkholderiaceae bacterium]
MDKLERQDIAMVQLGRFLKNSGYCFTTVTPKTHALVNGRAGNEWACDLEGIFGWNRPFQAQSAPIEILDLMHAAGVAQSHGDGWRSMVRASTLNGNLYFHSSYPTTETDAVFFGPDTYRFVSAIDHYLMTGRTVHRAVDIGCGAGPGTVAVALRQPWAEVSAVDINDAALRLARINATLAGVDNIRVLYSDLLRNVPGEFDLIVANPPYLNDSARRAYRHGGGPLGAGLSLAIVDAALQHLSPGGALLLYSGAAIVQGVDAFRLAVEQKLRVAKFQWQYREIDPDVFGEELLCPAYAGADRIAAVLLTASRATVS